MERISKVVRLLLRHLKDSRGVSLYEISAAVAMSAILAAVAAPVILDQVVSAKIARAGAETANIFSAMQGFQKDTGKIPGEVEGIVLLVSGVQGSTAIVPLPDGADASLGVVPGAMSGTGCVSCANINDFLVRNPNPPGGTIIYQNWHGPYMDEVLQDPFDRAYVVNVRALYKAEPASSQSNTCGYGWVLSGGPDRILQTDLLNTNLATNSDDIGKNNGKKNPPGPGC